MLWGHASGGPSTFSIEAAGIDIWGTSDQFHFVYQPITGDADVVARVDSLTQTHDWAKAGVMIRGALTASAAHANAVVTAAHGVAFIRRTAAGGTSTITAGPAGTMRWVRLVRRGTQVTSLTSADGVTWTVIGTETIALGSTAYVGIAVTSHNAFVRTTAAFSNVVAYGLGLPEGQQHGDIGLPAIAGDAVHQSGTYWISAGGRDIWDASDQFHFVYQQVTGNAEIVARVTSIAVVDGWTKAGVMMRESLAANSRNAAALITGSNGLAFQRRTETGSLSEYTNGGAGAAPGWVKLVRSGSVFQAYRSSNGVTWTPMGSDSIAMSATFYVGIAVTSRKTTASTVVSVDNVRITETQPVNQPPVVSITSPATASTFTAPATISVTATASDPENRMSRVDFYRNGTLVGADTTAPYAMTMSSVPAGSYSLTAVAVDLDGASTTSAAVSVTVNAPNQPPTVSLTAPANGTTYTAPATIAMTATASDPENRLSRVDFFRNGTLVGTDSTSPFTASMSSVAAGSYSLTAVAVDLDGGSTTSAAVTVTVNGPNQPPTVSLTEPANGATYTAPATIAVTATASDPENRMSRVDFYRNGTLVGGDTTAPYTVTMSSVAAGTYTLTAVARDLDGASTTAAAITVTVNAAPLPPTKVVFQASPDHAVVTSYLLEIFANGANPDTATPIASSSLGKPTPAADGDITVDRAAFFSALAPGAYQATVAAINANGLSRCVPVTFTR